MLGRKRSDTSGRIESESPGAREEKHGKEITSRRGGSKRRIRRIYAYELTERRSLDVHLPGSVKVGNTRPEIGCSWRRTIMRIDIENLTPEAHQAIVECLIIAARRGRLLREARERNKRHYRLVYSRIVRWMRQQSHFLQVIHHTK